MRDPAALVSSRQPLPDILLIVLDAARADHFPLYGYERETTPYIETLARDGLVFDSVYSGSPFTLTSTASLFTGTSWATHRVTAPGDALPESYLTLADLLALAGYLTLGMSDNPNVGHGSNLSQGFQEFTETWNSGRPFPLALPELFEERLAAPIPDRRPVFAYLHLLPPHAPYRPGPDHDLWKPADYDGSVDGSPEQLAEIERTDVLPGRADRDRWISLYDGNLHLADAITHRLVTAFERLERDRPLWIMITSDHGEAFGEHGFYEHLYDVHDEMTRIPLVLWPRDAWAGRSPEPSTFLSNTDVLPIVLNALGLESVARLYAETGPRTIDDEGSIHRRFVPMRSNASTHRFGIRTPELLAIQDGHRTQCLHEVESDPLLRRNLRDDEPGIYAREIGRLRRAVNSLRPLADAFAPDAAQPSEGDLDALRALGYIE